MKIPLSRKLIRLCIGVSMGVALAAFAAPAMAQFHGVAVAAACESPSKVGETVSCFGRFRNEDDFGDTHRVSEFWGVLDPLGLNIRVPEVGNAPITEVSAGVACTSAPVGPDAPLGLVFPCDVPAGADFVTISDTFVIPDVGSDVLEVQARLIEQDLCDDPSTSGCSTLENQQEQPAAINLFEPALEVTKNGPPAAKVGDEITYTIGFENTSMGASFPGFEGCTGSDTILGDLGAFDPAGETRNFVYTVSADDPNPLVNTATITCGVVGFNNIVSDSDDHSLDWIDPAITVSKIGPPTAKVGDVVTYTIGFANTGLGAVENCTGSDTVLGDLGAFEPGVDRTFDYTVSADDPNPLVNVATINCGVAGFDNQVSDSDDHSLDWINPEITVTKNGPPTAKVGDVVTYTIGFANTGLGAVENCTGSDTVLGDLGAFEPGVDRTFDYTIAPDDPNPLVNVATINCGVAGFDNQVSDSDDHSLDLINPSVSIEKLCRPDPVGVGETIEWEITVTNTGDTGIDCLVNDAEAGIIDEALSLAAGEFDTLNASRIVAAGETLISNTATVDCTVPGFDNQLSDEATADCEVAGDLICRTPGFWGTHAGEEKRRSSNLTQTVIDAAGGSLSICGQTIDNTDVGNMQSAVEAMCVRIQGEQQRQLARQLTAMALNCVTSGGGADCSGTSVSGLFADANASCTADDKQVNFFIERVDCFNNGGEFDEDLGMCVIGSCSATGDPCYDDSSCPLDDLGEPQQCVPFEGNCHDRELDASTDIFDGISPLPGPAGSSRACSSATRSATTVVPAL